MGSWPKISFVIPVYNRAHLIQDALHSLKKQTIPEWEAIVVDDHSTDNLEKAVKGFDSRVFYVRLPNKRGRGVSCARNYGNLLARASLIGVLDSDDLAKPNRAERAVKSYRKYHWDFYCALRETLNTVNQEIKTLTPQKIKPVKWDSELFKTQSYVTHSSVVYTKKAALEIPYNSSLPALDDYDLITRFIAAGKKMFLDPVVTAVYRRHSGETLSTHTDRVYQEKLLHAIRTWRGWEQENPYPESETPD